MIVTAKETQRYRQYLKPLLVTRTQIKDVQLLEDTDFIRSSASILHKDANNGNNSHPNPKNKERKIDLNWNSNNSNFHNSNKETNSNNSNNSNNSKLDSIWNHPLLSNLLKDEPSNNHNHEDKRNNKIPKRGI